MPQTLIAPLSFKTIHLTYKVKKSFIINRFNGTAIKGWLFDEALRKKSFYKKHEAFKNSLPKLPKYSNPPEYFVIKFPYDNRQLFTEGTSLGFSFTLIGDGIKLFDSWLQWFTAMDCIEIGYAYARGKLALQSIRIEEPISGNKLLQSIPSNAEALNLNFISPVELKEKDKPFLDSELPFYLLAKTALERIRLLNFFYAPGNLSIDDLNNTIELVEACQDINISHTDLVVDNKLFRSKEDKEKNSHNIPGLVGAIQYQAEISEWLPLLFAAQIVNIGHLSSWGMGQFIIDVR